MHFVFCDFIYSICCGCGFIQEFCFDTDSVYWVEQPRLSFRRLLRVPKRVQKQLPRMYFHQTNLKKSETKIVGKFTTWIWFTTWVGWGRVWGGRGCRTDEVVSPPLWVVPHHQPSSLKILLLIRLLVIPLPGAAFKYCGIHYRWNSGTEISIYAARS